MQKSQLVRSLLVGAAALALGTVAFAGENWIGTWKLDPAKSKLGTNVVRAQTLKFEVTPSGIKLSSEGIDPDGRAVKGGYVSKFDGKDVPWAGNPMADTACPKKVDDNTYENIWKQGGKATVTATVAVSNDGKTLTVTQSGKDPSGAAVSSVAVYDKQ